MFIVHNFTDMEIADNSISHNIVSISYTDLTVNEPSLPHSHQYTEIMIVAEGKGELVVNNTRIPFQKNNLYFVNPNTEHLETSDNVLKYYVVKMNNFTIYQTDTFKDVISLELNYGSQQLILTRLAQALEDCNLKGNLQKKLLSLDLAYLSNYFIYILQDEYYISPIASKRKSSNIQAIVNYISANYALDLKVSDLAAQFSFSHNNLLYHFQKELGMSPSEFITMQRMHVAKGLLKNTDYTIIQISTLCGFSTPSFFGKVFRKLENMTPTQYRKKYCR